VKAAYSLEEGSNHLAFPISAVLEQPPEKVKQKLRSEYFFSRLQLLGKYQRCCHRRPLKLFRTIQIWDFRVSKRVVIETKHSGVEELGHLPRLGQSR
jgi:hypothetical protein